MVTYPYYVSQNANPDLRWERKFEYNLGIDYSFLQNRLYGTIDMYIRNTKDLLWYYNVPTPPYQFGTLLDNAGEMTAMGMEVAISGVPVKTKNWEWVSTWTMAFNKNTIDKLKNTEKDINYDVKSTGNVSGNRRNGDNYTQRLQEGKQVGAFYGYKWTGDYDANHNLIYEDNDGDGKPDVQYLGSAQPIMTYGWNNTVRWKDLDISIFFRGNIGNKALNCARFLYTPARGSNGVNVFYSEVKNFVNGDGTFYQADFSDYYLEDASFIKLDNITIGYNIPLPENKYCKKLRVHFTAQNLFTISGYSGMDPDRVNTTSIEATGIDYVNFYPSTRQFQIGVNATF